MRKTKTKGVRSFSCRCRNVRIQVTDCLEMVSSSEIVSRQLGTKKVVHGTSLTGFQPRFSSLGKRENVSFGYAKFSCLGCRTVCGMLSCGKKDSREFFVPGNLEEGNGEEKEVGVLQIVLPTLDENKIKFFDLDDRKEFAEVRKIVQQGIEKEKNAMDNRVKQFIEKEKLQFERYKRKIKREKHIVMNHISSVISQESKRKPLTIKTDLVIQESTHEKESPKPVVLDGFYSESSEGNRSELSKDTGTGGELSANLLFEYQRKDEEEEGEDTESDSESGKQEEELTEEELNSPATPSIDISRKDRIISNRSQKISKLATSLPIRINRGGGGRGGEFGGRYIFEEKFSFIDSYMDFKKEFFGQLKEKNQNLYKSKRTRKPSAVV